MQEMLQPALAGSVIDAGKHRFNVVQDGYKPGDITPFGIIISDDFFRQGDSWITHNRLISAEAYGALALIWMPYPIGATGQYYQADGTVSTTISHNTIGTVVAVHQQMCELLLNVVPQLEETHE